MDMVNDIQENYTTGYISVFRSLKNKGWYKKSEYVHLWIHLLIKATHKGIEFLFNGENITLKPGQIITGRKTLSEETGINESKIERILNFFEKNEHQIEQQKSNKSRLISILNWDLYQKSEQQNEQQLNNKRTTTEQQLNTNNNDNNDNNKKNDNKYIPEFDDFFEFAKTKKPNINEYNLKLKYDSWIENGWKDGYNKPIKNWKSKVLNIIPYIKDETDRKINGRGFESDTTRRTIEAITAGVRQHG